MNLDVLKRFPNQTFEKRYNGCVGESIADVLANKHAIADGADPDFSEAAGYWAQGVLPSNAGEDLFAGMFGAVAAGALPEDSDTSDPEQTSELIENNFGNYTLTQKQTASIYAEKGIKPLYSYDEIASWLLQKRQGVVMGMRWFQSFNSPYPDGVLRTPPADEIYFKHAVAVYENASQGLRIKPWEGPDYGDHGYAYLNRDVFARCAPFAYGFDDSAWRWLSLVQGALRYPHNIPTLLPLITASSKMNR